MESDRLKLVVFGAFGAGKTTLIKTLDPSSKHIEARCAGGTTTIALDFGRVDVNGRQVYLFGTPGQERFEFAREVIGRGMDGAILLIDATGPYDEFIAHLHGSLAEAKKRRECQAALAEFVTTLPPGQHGHNHQLH